MVLCGNKAGPSSAACLSLYKHPLPLEGATLDIGLMA